MLTSVVGIFDNSVGPSSTAPLVSPSPSSTIPNRKSGIRNRNNRRVFNRFYFSNRKYSPLLRPPRRITTHLDRTGRSILSTNNLATGFRQGTAFYPEARRAAVPLHARAPGVLNPEACFRRLLGPCLRNVAVTTTHSSLVTRSSQADPPRRSTHHAPLVARSSQGDPPKRTARHFRLIDNPARIVVLSDQRESKDLSSVLVLIAGSAIRNQNIRRDFSNFHFSNRR